MVFRRRRSNAKDEVSNTDLEETFKAKRFAMATKAVHDLTNSDAATQGEECTDMAPRSSTNKVSWAKLACASVATSWRKKARVKGTLWEHPTKIEELINIGGAK